MELRHLARLELNGTPLSEIINYRQDIFEKFILLEVVDGMDRNHEKVDSDLDEEGPDSSESESEFSRDGESSSSEVEKKKSNNDTNKKIH